MDTISRPATTFPWRVSLAVACALLCALPLLSFLYFGLDHLGESLAYRYFSSARIVGAGDKTVWLPQGHLVSALQHALYAFVDSRFADIPVDHLRERFNLFGVLTNGVVCVFNALLLLAVFLHRRFTGLECALIAVVALAPIYATGSGGIYYSTVPDYYHLDMIIVTTATALFIFNMHAADTPLGYGRAATLAAFVGLAASNKITMAPIAAAALLPLVAHSPRLPAGQLLKLGIVMAVSGVFSFLMVLWAFQGFHLSRVRPMLNKMAGFAGNVDVQPQFMSLLNTYLFVNKYAYFLAAFVIVVAVAAIRNRPSLSGRSFAVALPGIALTGAIYVWLIFRRPAGTTMFETAVALFGLTVMTVALIRPGRLKLLLTLALWCMTITVAVQGPSPRALGDRFVAAKTVSDKGWRLFDRIQGEGRSVYVVVPDNEYTWGDPFEVLLKGSADFPTWDITSRRAYLESFRAPIHYRTEQGGDKPDQPYPAGVTIVWFDRAELPSLPSRYPSLARAIAGRRCETMPIDRVFRAGICIQ